MAEERKATAALMAEKVRRQEEYEERRDAGNHPGHRRSFLD
jgi:hypothetical protein